MTQIRPRLDGDLAAEVQAYADSLSRELGTHISFNAVVTVLLRRALRAVSQEHDAGSTP